MLTRLTGDPVTEQQVERCRAGRRVTSAKQRPLEVVCGEQPDGTGTVGEAAGVGLRWERGALGDHPSGESGRGRRSSRTIGPRSVCRDMSSICVGVDCTQRCCSVIVSQRRAAGFPARRARSRCCQVRVSAPYQRNPCRRAIRVAMVVLPVPGGSPIQRTCLSACTPSSSTTAMVEVVADDGNLALAADQGSAPRRRDLGAEAGPLPAETPGRGMRCP